MLKPVWIGHVDKGRVVFHHFSHSSVQGFLFARATATVDAIVPLRSSFGLALGSDTSDLFSRRFIKRFPTAMLPCFQMRCIACHVC